MVHVQPWHSKYHAFTPGLSDQEQNDLVVVSIRQVKVANFVVNETNSQIINDGELTAVWLGTSPGEFWLLYGLWQFISVGFLGLRN